MQSKALDKSKNIDQVYFLI